MNWKESLNKKYGDMILKNLPKKVNSGIILMIHIKLLKVGSSLLKLGWKPKLPVIIIPGLASTSLTVVESHDDGWHNERLWYYTLLLKIFCSLIDRLSLSRLGGQKFEKFTDKIRKNLFHGNAPNDEMEPELSETEKQFRVSADH